jgi:hypothetical protein
MNEVVILTRNLSKTYGNCEAVRELNLSVGRNRITAFLSLYATRNVSSGPNGSQISTVFFS